MSVPLAADDARDAAHNGIGRFVSDGQSALAQSGAVDWTHVNPATGPVYVEGAEPGDVMEIRFLRITPKAFGKDRRMPITNRYGG